MVSVNFDTSSSDVPVTRRTPSPDFLPFPPLFAFVLSAVFPRARFAILDGTDEFVPVAVSQRGMLAFAGVDIVAAVL